tara:strand:- start:484 stop:957 length:474 start_codon:yes stop_codon:yes gene_type:complete
MSDFDGVDFFKEVGTASEKTVVPKGVHEASILRVEDHTTAAGDKAQKVVFEMEGGQYFDQTEYFNLWHSKENVKRIANEQFSSLVLAVGMDALPNKKEELIGKKLRVVVGKKDEPQPDGSVKEYTNIKGYLASTKAGVSSASSGGSSAVGSKPSLSS